MKENRFKQRLDFYGQSLAAYVIILAIFLISKGTLQEGDFTFKMFWSPLVILLIAIIIITAMLLLIVALKQKEIIIDDNSITFKSRMYNKTIKFSQIQRIKINNSPSRVVKADASFVRIKIKDRKKIILIRTASYVKENELLEQLKNVAHNIHEKY